MPSTDERSEASRNTASGSEDRHPTNLPDLDGVSVTVLVPTLNESDNVDPLLRRVSAALDAANLQAEILVVDGGSRDGTQDRVRQWETDARVRLVQGDGTDGLSGDVLCGARAAQGDVVVVMDADLSHPPESIAQLVRPVLDGSCDMALGSRYVPGGKTPGWSWRRRIMSRTASALAWPIVEQHDPMSGFFAVRRDALLEYGSRATGFKIALEILAIGQEHLRVQEIPITFRDRDQGRSKFGARQVLAYLSQLIALCGGAASTGTGARFALVGAIGMVLDFSLFSLLLAGGARLLVAHLVSFLAATLLNYTLNARWAFARVALETKRRHSHRYLRFLAVCVSAFLLRGAVLTSLVDAWSWAPRAAILAAIGGAAIANFLGSAFFVFPSTSRAGAAARRRVAILAIVGYALVLRALYAPLLDLLPEEAYYWMYAQDLSLGYLDHPPAVAWLIALGTRILGQNELGVRLPALVCWGITAFFLFRLARNLFDRNAAFASLLLVAVCPIYFSVGLVMTPDAPLHACWAGCLYFLERAMLHRRGSAWVGVAVCAGLGLLSKYTIGLLAPAALVFLATDPDARSWLRRPHPYVAALGALLLFSPVILWNMQNHWASFAFQGTRRLSHSPSFSLHLLLGSAALLLTPVGLVGIVAAMLSRRGREPASERSERGDRSRRFALIFTLVPLTVFVAFSLRHPPKLNWTGPVWLAAIPLMASWMYARLIEAPKSNRVRRVCMPASALTTLVLGVMLYYLALGMPGMPPMKHLSALPVAWKETVGEINNIERRLTRQMEHPPVLVGMDKYFTSSQIAFYDWDHDGPTDTSARHLFGRTSLMWASWSPVDSVIGRNVLLVGFEPDDLASGGLESYFEHLGEVRVEPIRTGDRVAAKLYWRVGYSYTDQPFAGTQVSTGLEAARLPQPLRPTRDPLTETGQAPLLAAAGTAG
jgi:dolichol-phosphate mannosyltransferase